ncbi:MAG: nucleotide exchange factor GrpE [Cyclobacteriaceae bacterium]
MGFGSIVVESEVVYAIMMDNKVEQEEKNIQQDETNQQNNLDAEHELESHENAVDANEEIATQQVELADEMKASSDPFKKLQDDLAEAKEKYVRLYAEFENHRRRTAKEKLEMIQSANEQLIKQLLPVIDDFERAEKASTEKKENGLEGFLLIQNKLKKNLEQYGLKAMETEVGSDFNPDLHEAITQIKAEDKNKGKVVDVIEKGYLLNEKVIRYAKVVVGN